MLYNGPQASQPPEHPERVTTFIMGCGLYSSERDVELAGGKVQRKGLG